MLYTRGYRIYKGGPGGPGPRAGPCARAGTRYIDGIAARRVDSIDLADASRSGDLRGSADCAGPPGMGWCRDRIARSGSGADSGADSGAPRVPGGSGSLSPWRQRVLRRVVRRVASSVVLRAHLAASGCDLGAGSTCCWSGACTGASSSSSTRLLLLVLLPPWAGMRCRSVWHRLQTGVVMDAAGRLVSHFGFAMEETCCLLVGRSVY